MSNFLRRAAAMLEDVSGGKSFRVECKCGVQDHFANEKTAKLGGWWYDTRNGWLCPTHNTEHDTQVALPFELRSLTDDDQREITKYLDVKDDGTNEPINTESADATGKIETESTEATGRFIEG